MSITPELILALLGSGIGSSLVTEGISFLNKKLADTPLKGAGSLLMSGCVAFLAGAIQVYFSDTPNPQSWRDILAITAAVWSASQAFFHVVLKRIDALHVTPQNFDPLA